MVGTSLVKTVIGSGASFQIPELNVDDIDVSTTLAFGVGIDPNMVDHAVISGHSHPPPAPELGID